MIMQILDIYGETILFGPFSACGSLATSSTYGAVRFLVAIPRTETGLKYNRFNKFRMRQCYLSNENLANISGGQDFEFIEDAPIIF